MFCLYYTAHLNFSQHILLYLQKQNSPNHQQKSRQRRMLAAVQTVRSVQCLTAHWLDQSTQVGHPYFNVIQHCGG